MVGDSQIGKTSLMCVENRFRINFGEEEADEVANILRTGSNTSKGVMMRIIFRHWVSKTSLST